MDQLTAVFAVLGETYFKLRMAQDQLETANEEKSVLIHDNNEMKFMIEQKIAEEEAALAEVEISDKEKVSDA